MRRSLAALALALLLPLPVLAGQVTVKPGETLSEIADRHGISLSKLMQLNGIRKADHVEVGQVLKLPGHARSSGRSSGRTTSTGTVRVQEGDTLSEIADRQGMSLSQLMALNGISKADHVEVGQVLKVSGKPAPAAPAYRRGASTHVVKAGESLSEIAEGYGVPMSRLIAINDLSDPDHVEIGSRLKLQGPAPAPRPVVSTAPVRPKPQPRPAAATPSPTTARMPAANASSGDQAVSKATSAAATTPEPIADQIVSRAASPAVNPAISSAAIPSRATAISSAIETPASSTLSRPLSNPATRTSASPLSSASSGAAESVLPTSSPYRSTSATTSPVVAPTSNPVRTTSTAAMVATAAASPAPAPRPSATPARSTATTTAAATQATAPGDWRRYGPLQVDWSGWQPMGGSLVAPVMNAKGDTLYLAINCGARKLNATSSAGDWRTWDNPQADFEQKLVNDLCRSRSL